MIASTYRSIAILVAGVVLGIVLTYAANSLLTQRGWTKYHVASIKNHYSRKDDNSQTTVLVFIEGAQGHVKEVLCLFPPSLRLQGEDASYADNLLEGKKANWSGLEIIEVGPLGQEFIGGTGYLCRKVK